MKIIRVIIYNLIPIILITTACSKATATQSEEDKILSQMTLEEKIYQMFIVTPEQLTGVAQVTAAGETTRKALEEHPVGGIIYFAQNLKSEEQATKMIENIQQYSMDIQGMKLFTAIDEEGGTVTRIGGKSGFDAPNVGDMANISSPDEAYNAGNTIGGYLSEIGINLDFAPDVDVLTNSNNTVVKRRSFGSDPAEVSAYGQKVSDGLHANGVLSTYKHFPGHGATTEDTHKGFAVTTKTYEELLKSELIPFSKAQADGADFVMVAHISLPNIVGDNTPASLSKVMITDILKGDLGYQGIVITDAMGMGAIVNEYDKDESVVMAIEAGADMILMPENLESACSAIKNAVQKGEIAEERIDESVRKIIEKKMDM
ncbi:MAG: glycoside hydrolase family 3 protein [Butyrivibrio sp.]|nr:glycoside hydrolase family 3 protein [Butyrivibrio sp.]